MKLLACILGIACCAMASAQVVVVQINAKWNDANTRTDLELLRRCEYRYGSLEDQHPDLQRTITAVPLVVVYLNDQAVQQWAADLSFRLDTPLQEIQQVVNSLHEEK